MEPAHNARLGQRNDATEDVREPNQVVEWNSRADAGRRSRLSDGRCWRACLSGSTSLAHTRSSLQEGNFPASQAAVVDKFVADTATRPSAAEQRLVSIQSLLADLAMAGLDSQQHRFPLATGFSDTHGEGV